MPKVTVGKRGNTKTPTAHKRIVTKKAKKATKKVASNSPVRVP